MPTLDKVEGRVRVSQFEEGFKFNYRTSIKSHYVLIECELSKLLVNLYTYLNKMKNTSSQLEKLTNFRAQWRLVWDFTLMIQHYVIIR